MDIVEFFVPEIEMVKGDKLKKVIDKNTQVVVNFKMFTDIPKLRQKPACLRKKGNYPYKGKKARRPRKYEEGIFDVDAYNDRLRDLLQS